MRGQLAVRLRAVLVAGVHATTIVIQRVMPAPQDPVVGREPVVVELIGAVGHALPGTPADTVQLDQRLDGFRARCGDNQS